MEVLLKEASEALPKEERYRLSKRYYLAYRKLERIVYRTPASWEFFLRKEKVLNTSCLMEIDRVSPLLEILLNSHSYLDCKALKESLLKVLPAFRRVRLEYSGLMMVARELKKELTALERSKLISESEYRERLDLFERKFGKLLPKGLTSQDIDGLISELKALREELWRAHSQMIFWIAKKLGVPPEDFYSTGVEAFFRALDKYSPFKSKQLTTVAYYWIKQALKRESRKELYPVSLTTYAVKKEESLFCLSLDREDDDGFSLKEVLKSPEIVEEKVEKKILVEKLLKSLGYLTELERRVLYLKFHKGLSFKEINKLGISNPAETYRRAVRKLRTYLGVEDGKENPYPFKESAKGKRESESFGRRKEDKRGDKEGFRRFKLGELFSSTFYGKRSGRT